MPAYYSIIKFVPNPVADESINVGVVAYCGDQVEIRITSRLTRARSFAKRDPSALRDALADIKRLRQSGELSESRIRRIADTWTNQVQVTQPRASIQTVEELIDEVAPLYLPEEELVHGVRRPGKRRAVKLAIDSLTVSLTSRFQSSKASARRIIRVDYPAHGRLEDHDLDLAVVNGALRVGAMALSLVQENRQHLKREIDATAFAIEDMRKQDSQVPLCVLAYAEGGEPDDVSRIEGLFGNWGVPVVTEKQIELWSHDVVEKLPDDVMALHV